MNAEKVIALTLGEQFIEIARQREALADRERRLVAAAEAQATSKEKSEKDAARIAELEAEVARLTAEPKEPKRAKAQNAD